jgi:hypothetical protein
MKLPMPVVRITPEKTTRGNQNVQIDLESIFSLVLRPDEPDQMGCLRIAQIR